MSRNKANRHTIVFTDGELKVVSEAIISHKKKLKAKATSMQAKHGYQPRGKHQIRNEQIRSAQKKITEHLPKTPPKKIPDASTLIKGILANFGGFGSTWPSPCCMAPFETFTTHFGRMKVVNRICTQCNKEIK